jgi:two-component system response regulator RegX3
MTTVSVMHDRSEVDDLDEVGSDADPHRFQVREVVLDLAAHLVTVGGRDPIPLPSKEFGVLSVLMAHAGRIVSHDELVEQVWGPGGAPAKSIEVFIRRLRRHLEADPHHPRYIRTVRGYGYIIDVR